MSETAFLRAICADPDDDTARLVFADWLSEHGAPVRSEFIRAQFELARMDQADPHYPALLAQSRRCGMLTGDTHRLECERRVYGGAFRRGFIAGIDADGYHFPECDLLPVEQLRLYRPDSDPYGDVKTLAARPELMKVRTLCFGGTWSTRDLRAILVNNPRLAGLRALAVGETDGEYGPALREIVPQFVLPALDSLALHLGSFNGNPEDDSDELDEEPQDDWNAFLPARGPALRRLFFDGSGDDNGE